MTDLSPLSHAARRRFVKDYGLPIQVVQDPHFAYLLDLYEPFFGSRTKLGLLIDEIRDSGSEEAFFVRANRLTDAVIKAVRDTPAYQFLSEDHLADYDIGPSTFAADSLYRPDNDGRAIIAVDLVKANFQAMRYYDPSLVLHAGSYEAMLGRFSDRPYHLGSRQTRQVIFGHLQPKQQQKIQRWIMRQLMEKAATLRGLG